MKFFINSLLYLLVLFLFEDSAYSITDKQIKEICRKNVNTLTCIKNLKYKKSNLIKGNRIEIPVIPFKK